MVQALKTQKIPPLYGQNCRWPCAKLKSHIEMWNFGIGLGSYKTITTCRVPVFSSSKIPPPYWHCAWRQSGWQRGRRASWRATWIWGRFWSCRRRTLAWAGPCCTAPWDENSLSYVDGDENSPNYCLLKGMKSASAVLMGKKTASAFLMGWKQH